MLRWHKDRLAPRYEAYVQSKPLLLLLSMFNWPRRQIRRLYAWVVGWADSKQAERALGGIAFAESSVFPVPPDPLLIAMTTAKPRKWLRFAFICTAASIAGGILGYFIGVGLFETVGRWVVDTYHLQEDFDAIGLRYAESAFLTIVIAAFTPIPYKLIAISAGVFHVNFMVFVAASVLGRGIRFFLVAYLMHHFGRRYKDKIERYVDILSILFIALVVLGFVVVKLLL
jgi:membrane protein YqaA with SNARE-associated domain